MSSGLWEVKILLASNESRLFFNEIVHEKYLLGYTAFIIIKGGSSQLRPDEKGFCTVLF